MAARSRGRAGIRASLSGRGTSSLPNAPLDSCLPTPCPATQVQESQDDTWKRRGRGRGRGRGRCESRTFDEAAAMSRMSLGTEDRLDKHAKPGEELSVEEAERLVAAGELVQGSLRVNAKNPAEAYVSVESYTRDVAIVGFERRGRALEGDAVALSLLPSDGSGHRNQISDVQFQARVVCVLERKHRVMHIGHIRQCAVDDLIEFVPHDVRYPCFHVPAADCPEELLVQLVDEDGAAGNMLLSAKIESWPRESAVPLARLVDVLGQAGDIAAETNALLIENSIDASPFPPEVLADLPQASTFQRILSQQVPLRRDFRQERVCTIDPSTARDLDDAIHIKGCGDGTFEVGVHIADVSFFVRAGSDIDSYAATRGTTTYLTQYCLPMLPHTLSEELCSLNPKEDRLAFSVVWRFTADGQLLTPSSTQRKSTFAASRDGSFEMGGLSGGGAIWIGRSVIRSKCRMAYETAQGVIEGRHDQLWPDISTPEGGVAIDDIKADILALHRITSALRARRFSGGSVAINQNKVGFKLGPDGIPEDMIFYRQREANQLVEELMLLANQTVAQVVSEAHPDRALLRRHPQPIEKGLQDVEKLCAATGLALNGTSSAELQRLLENVAARGDGVLAMVVRQQAAKAMQLAQYFSTGELDSSEWRHYALAMNHYTHFTSPIRRYPDIVVHRLLQAAIWGVEHGGLPEVAGERLIDWPLWESHEVARHATHCNETKWNAKAAQEASTALFLRIYLDKHPMEQEPAIVTSLGTFSFTIYVAALAQEFRIDDRKLSVKPTWTHPNRQKEGQALLGTISFEWDPAKLPRGQDEEGSSRRGGGGRKGRGRGGQRGGEKVVMHVNLLSQVAVRVAVDKSTHPWSLVATVHAPLAAHALVADVP